MGLRVMLRVMLEGTVSISRVAKGLAVLAALWILLGAIALGQTSQRLILTDGSYQSVNEFHKEGERVRYLSAERGEWEELPTALVDWKATAEWNSTAMRGGDEEELKQVTAEEVAARKEAMKNTPLVAPDMRLPAEGGVFLFEEVGGKPALHKVPTQHLSAESKTGSNMLRHAVNPFASVLLTLELKGREARVRIHSPGPVLYVDIDDETGTVPGERYRIVRLAADKGRNLRVVGRDKVSMKGNEQASYQVVKTRAEKFSGDWWKVVPVEPLAPGEYAVVIESDSQETNADVWDFGVEK
jgi:hypothetical protein